MSVSANLISFFNAVIQENNKLVSHIGVNSINCYLHTPAKKEQFSQKYTGSFDKIRE